MDHCGIDQEALLNCVIRYKVWHWLTVLKLLSLLFSKDCIENAAIDSENGFAVLFKEFIKKVAWSLNNTLLEQLKQEPS